MYRGLHELPEAIQSRLPVPAQQIYQTVFNNTWDDYSHPRDAETGSREEAAHKVAWSAVKRKYRKTENNKWTPKGG